MFYRYAFVASSMSLFWSIHVAAKESISPECEWTSPVDLQPCIQAAIETAAAIHGTVIIPKGIWPLGRSLILPSFVRLIGESSQTTLSPKADNISKPLLLEGYDVNHIFIADLIFDGGGSDFPNKNPLIEITKSNYVTVSAIKVQHSHGIGLLIQGGVTHAIVRGSSFTDLGNLWKMTHQRSDRIQGVVFCCGDNSHNSAMNNIFRDVGLDALQMSDQTDFTALRNSFELENNQRGAVPSEDYAAAIFLADSKRGLIQDNEISGAQGNCIDAPAVQATIIERNKISNCGEAGIGIFVGYDKIKQSKYVRIRDNILTNNVQWGKFSPFQGGITISGGTPESILIERNTAYDDQLNKTQAYGLMISSGTQVHNIRIVNNKFDRNAISPIYRPPPRNR